MGASFSGGLGTAEHDAQSVDRHPNGIYKPRDLLSVAPTAEMVECTFAWRVVPNLKLLVARCKHKRILTVNQRASGGQPQAIPRIKSFARSTVTSSQPLDHRPVLQQSSVRPPQLEVAASRAM
jgi:hypothetical protein